MNALANIEIDALARLATPALVTLAIAAIERAGSFADLKVIVAKAEALRSFQRAISAGTEAMNAAAEIRIRAQRRMGEELGKAELATGARGNPGGQGAPVVRSLEPTAQIRPTLAEIGISKDQSSRYQHLAAIPGDTFEAVIEAHKEAAEPISTASVARTAHAIEGLSDDARASLIEQGENQLLEVANRIKEEHNHRAQGTGENEWYTPSEHLDAARRVLGTIDLDPASSEVANRTVDAVQYFTLADDGLAKPWRGAVWMNPPYAQPWIMRFAQKLRASVESGDVTQAVALTHNYTDTAWFHLLAERADAICFTRGRISFLSPEGKKAAPTQGQAFFYFGANRSAFVEQFAQFGMIMMRHVI